jgi:hypothetical protein
MIQLSAGKEPGVSVLQLRWIPVALNLGDEPVELSLPFPEDLEDSVEVGVPRHARTPTLKQRSNDFGHTSC